MLDYKYHATAITVAALISPIFIFLLSFEKMGAHTMLYPMILYPNVFWPWLFLLAILRLEHYRKTAEEKVILNFIAAFVIGIIVPTLAFTYQTFGILFKSTNNIDRIGQLFQHLAMSGAYAVFCCAIYVALIKIFIGHKRQKD